MDSYLPFFILPFFYENVVVVVVVVTSKPSKFRLQEIGLDLLVALEHIIHLQITHLQVLLCMPRLLHNLSYLAQQQ